MAEEILDILASSLEIFLISSSSKKKKEFKVDRMIKNWSTKVGLHFQSEYKDEKIRSLSVVDDSGNTYQIWIETLKWGRAMVGVTNNKSGRKRKKWSKKCRISNLTKTLFEAYGVTEQWILKSGTTRTVK